MEYYIKKNWDLYEVFESIGERSDKIAAFVRLEDAELFIREKEKEE
jgi:hypothetical protein